MSFTPRPMKDVLADVKKGTGGAARRTSQEQLDESRIQAAGRAARKLDPEFHTWAKAEVESRARRAVMGLISNKGRQPMWVLSEGQFATFKQTGTWEGAPSPEEYGSHSYVPEDKEYT